MAKQIWVYDLETSPNFFSAVFKELGKDNVKIFAACRDVDLTGRRFQRTFLGKDYDIEIQPLHEMKTWINRKRSVQIGFNSINFDDPILNFWLTTSDPRIHEAYNIGQEIIGSDKGFATLFNAKGKPRRVTLPDGLPKYIKRLRWADTNYDGMDLMKMVEAATRPSLKSVAIHLKWPLIQDLPYPYDYALQSWEEVDEFLKYNLNDVLITEALAEVKRSAIKMRFSIAKKFDIDPYRACNSSDSGLCNLLMTKMWGGKPTVESTLHTAISVKDCIGDNIDFKSEEMQLLRRVLESLTLSANPIGMPELDEFDVKMGPKGKYAYIGDCIRLELSKAFGEWKFNIRFTFRGVSYDVGVGGLHTVDKENPGVWKSNEDSDLVDADVTSYYPAIIVNNRIYPAHLGEEFVEKYESMMVERVEAKAIGDMITSNGLKVTINGGFGKFNSKYFWLYDKKCMFKTTISGQLYLLYLIEKLGEIGIECISANTDGILCIVPKDKRVAYNQICQQWQDETKFGLEFDEYSSYGRRDVNNYFAVKTNGKVKTKGVFDDNSYDNPEYRNFARGYSPTVISDAIVAYFVNGVDVAETIFACNDVHKFINTHRAAGNFKQYLEKTTKVFGGKSEFIDLQKTNRYVYFHDNGTTENWGMYRKLNTVKSTVTSIDAVYPVRIVNDMDSTPIGEMGINYGAYIEKARKIIKGVIGAPNVQLSLF